MEAPYKPRFQENKGFFRDSFSPAISGRAGRKAPSFLPGGMQQVHFD